MTPPLRPAATLSPNLSPPILTSSPHFPRVSSVPPSIRLTSPTSPTSSSLLSSSATTPNPLPVVSLYRPTGVHNHYPNPILAIQCLDTIPEGPSAHYRVAVNEFTHATPKPRPREVGASHINLATPPNGHGYQQTQAPSLPRSEIDWQEVKKQREREAEHRKRGQERVEREQRRQQREQREREQLDQEQGERKQREREQGERDLQEREQRERERIERERKEQGTGIGSRHAGTTYVDPYVNTSTKNSAHVLPCLHTTPLPAKSKPKLQPYSPHYHLRFRLHP